MRITTAHILTVVALYKEHADRTNVWEMVGKAWNSMEMNKGQQFTSISGVSAVFMRGWHDFCANANGAFNAEVRPVDIQAIRALANYLELRSSDPAWCHAMSFDIPSMADPVAGPAGGAAPMAVDEDKGAPSAAGVDGAEGEEEAEVEDNSLVGVWLRLLFSGSAFDMHGDVRLRCNQPNCDCLLYRHNATRNCAQCDHAFTSHAFGILSISRVLDSISDLVSQHKDLFWNLMLNQCTAFGDATQLVAALESEITSAESAKRKREADDTGADEGAPAEKKPKIDGSPDVTQ
eukprot:c40436_g1_i1.p1 GENE.c40436_g1_i1~~c40436_g1_i1.p1  ORF type:complete len:291 (+),score=43.94 c40436_g1_i1:107-979(+)